MKHFLTLVLALSLASCSKPTATNEASLGLHSKSNINWRHEWNDKVFEDAKAQNKLVILSLEAIWCHWCHVMQDQTYPNPQVEKLLNDNFISISIDQDSNSYLSNRYKDYGWPATIFFNSNGEEIAKRAGYMEAQSMIDLLEKLIKDPSPEKNYSRKITYSTISYLTEQAKFKLKEKYSSSLDLKEGGLNSSHKYVDRDTIEYDLILAKQGDNRAKQHGLLTLKAAQAIMDPEWGGFYQYSTKYNWQNPHYEKLAITQAEYLRIYSLAQLQNPDADFNKAIDSIITYLKTFLSSKFGSFYTSQDADLVQGQKATEYFKLADKARRTQGIPRIDTNVYADKNGRMIEALALAYKAKQDPKLLEVAIKAVRVINQNYRRVDGCYVHGLNDKSSYLADNLFMARALLALYEVSAKRDWLVQANKTADYIVANYRADEPGYLSSSKKDRASNSKLNSILKPVPLVDENIKLARFFNKLSHYSGKAELKQEAKYIMQYLASEDLINASTSEPGILILDGELAEDPIHFTIVGSKQDTKARELFETALSYPSDYLRIEWYDSKEGKLLNHDVDYPEMPKAAAFSCVNHACSLPLFDKDELRESFSAD